MRQVIEKYPWNEVLRQDEYWMDRYGRKIKISRMSTRYINNVIPFVQRACMAKAFEWIGWLHHPLGPQGDMARDSFEREIEDMMDFNVPLMDALQKELNVRKWRSPVTEKIRDKIRR